MVDGNIPVGTLDGNIPVTYPDGDITFKELGMVFTTRIESPETLGRVIEQARLLRGLTQRDLAQLLATDQKYVWELESGKSTVAIERLLHAIDILNVTLLAEVPEREGDQ
jgi:ribosome-binding protein aMBF1 (putative translation factor)